MSIYSLYLIEAGNDFMIESNLADYRSYEWISLLKSKGYDIVLYYLSSDGVPDSTFLFRPQGVIE